MPREPYDTTGGTAFPVTGLPTGHGEYYGSPGMSLRDWATTEDQKAATVARVAYKIADAMLKARE